MDKLPTNRLGVGERAVIAYTWSHKDYLACLDDLLARRFAEQLGLRVIGIVGVLLKAKQKGTISGIKHVLDHLRREGFHLGDDVISEALHLAGEKS